jgi:Serpin (serine protease inhibitor)
MDYFSYSSTAVSKYQIVQLLLSETLSMILAVPTTKNAVLTNERAVLSALPQLARQRIALGLPKFQFETFYQDELQNALLNAGVDLPFAGGHLCIFENDCTPALDIVLQKTFISVDEKGVSKCHLAGTWTNWQWNRVSCFQVEAAAVTVGISTTSLPVDTPVEVMADLPFQFFIFDSATETVLFEGRVVDPKPQNTTVELTAKHTDADFWMTSFGVSAVRVFVDSPVPPPTVAPVMAPNLTPGTPIPPPVTAPTPAVVTAPTQNAPSPVIQMQSPIPAPPTAESSASASIVANMALSTLFMVAFTWSWWQSQ